MPSTYTPIATTTLGSNTANVTFSSISSAYTDLILVVTGAMTTANWVPALRFNSDTGSNYSTTLLEGSGSSAISERLSNQSQIHAGYSYGAWGTTLGENTCSWHIQNYSNSTTYKTVVGRNNVASGATSSYSGTVATVGLWRSTSAISTILVRDNSGTALFSSGSTFTLYGVKSA